MVMSKLILTDLVNLENQSTAVAALNANSAATETALENTLSRDGTHPNEMNSQLDMNSYRIINLPSAVSSSEPITLSQMNAILASGQVPNGLVSEGVPVSAVMQPFVDSAGFDIASNYLGSFSTRALAAAATIHSSVVGVSTLGYYTAGDFGAANYIRVGASTPGGFQSADGQWWGLHGPEVNVCQFGAKGDAVTDDLVAFRQAALFAAAMYGANGALGSTVIVPPANFVVSDTTVLTQHVCFKGHFGASAISTSSAGNSIFTVISEKSAITDLNLNTTVTRTSGDYITYTGSHGSFENLSLVNPFNGINVDGGTFGSFKNIFIFKPVAAGVKVDNVVSGSLDIFDELIVTGDGSGGTGIQIFDCGDLTVSNSQFVSTFYGIELTPPSGGVLVSVKFTDCFCDHNNTGLRIFAANSTVARSTFTSCEFTSATVNGVHLDISGTGAIDGLIFVNPTITGNASDGMVINNSAVSHINILGGLIGGNAGHGINIAANVSYFTCTGANVGAGGGWLGNGNRPIIVNSGTGDYLIIANNNFNGNGLAFINGATGIHQTTTGNLT